MSETCEEARSIPELEIVQRPTALGHQRRGKIIAALEFSGSARGAIVADEEKNGIWHGALARKREYKRLSVMGG